MASLVLKMSVSLDGYVAPADGSTGWATAGRSEDGAAWTLETVSNAGTHLIGGVTYARWATFWPGAAGPFAKPMNEIPKVVFSNSLTSADWPETTIATGDLAEAVTRLKQQRSGGYLLAQGGARFARSLVETGLIDEYRLVVHPVVLGAGEAALRRAGHDRADQHDGLQPRSCRPRLHGAIRDRARSVASGRTGAVENPRILGKVHPLSGVSEVEACQPTLREAPMRRFLVTACTVLTLGGVSATSALAADPHNQNGSPSTGQPSQSCQATDPPAFPGNTANSPGSAFNGTAGNVYANPTSQGGMSSGNPQVAAQYDVACFQQTQH